MKKQLVLFVLLFCCFSCSSQKKEIIAKSTIKLEGRNTNIRDLIEIDGYYTDPAYPHYNSIMFFENGVWFDFHFKWDIPEDERKTNMSKSMGIEDKWRGRCGVYKVEGDTIITYWYDKRIAIFWTAWSLREIRYKVINRETIQAIYSKSLLKRDETYYRDMNVSSWLFGSNLYYVPADSLPSSDCWLKEEKWIWRNEQDWKDYMQRIEQKKNKRN